MSGSNTADSEENYIAKIVADSISDNRSVVKVKKSGGIYSSYFTADDDIVETPSYTIAGFDNEKIGYNLYDSDASYMVSQDVSGNLDLSMDYENAFLTGSSMAGNSVIFDKSGFVQISGDSADYSISMTYNSTYPTDWFAIRVAGHNVDDSSLKMTSEGWILSADNLNNVDVWTNNKEDEAHLNFSTDYTSALIYEINKNTIGIKVDTDDNGTYETDIKTASSPTITKIEPGNGKMNITWNQLDNAESYIVYYKTGSTTKNVTRAATAKGALISGIANGTYEVWVTAMVDGKETSKGQSIQTTVKGYYVPCKTQAIESGTIEISWDAFPNALRYRVVCVNPDSTVRDTKITSKLSFKWQGLHNGEQYGFYVQPYINVGGYPATATEGVYPTFTRTDAKDKPYIQWTIPVNAPMITKLSLGNQKVWLYYESVPRATRYYIYKTVDGKDSLVGTTTATKYLATGLTNGKASTFYVKALVDGKLTPLKRPATRTTRAGMKPTITVTAGQAALKWSKYTDCKATATKYKVVFVDANYKQIASRETTNLSFTWKSSALKKGTKYGFYVVPYVNGEYIPFGLSYAEDKANVVMFTAK